MTALLERVPDVASSVDVAPPSSKLEPAPARANWKRQVGTKWPWLLALVSLGVYVAAGCFMLFSLHYAIGDALSRSEDARAVLYSRDPHLAAWGFVWFPGPVVLELPFMAVVSPLGYAALAGPLATATCGAFTVLVLVRLFRRFGLSEPVVAGLTLTYCLSPVIIFYCANGMSEAPFYLAAAAYLLGVVWWYQEGGPWPLLLVSMGLAAAMAIRYEALALVPLTALLAGFKEKVWGRRAKVAVLLVLPGAFVFCLWTLANWLIMGNALYWYQGQSAVAVPPASAGWLPSNRTLLNGIAYAAKYAWAFAPALMIMAPVLLVVLWARRRWSWELATLVVPVAVFPGQVALLMASDKTWGDPRYFASLTIFGAVTLGFAAREVGRTRGLGPAVRRALCVLLVCMGAWDAVSGTLNDINPKTSAVESEYIPFRAAFALSPAKAVAGAKGKVPPLLAWERFDAYIDPYLSRGQLIMVDTTNAFTAVLYSPYPGQWIIPSDDDFQKQAENFAGQFQWALKTPDHINSFPSVEISQSLTDTQGGHWRRVKDFGSTIGTLYHWEPTPS